MSETIEGFGRVGGDSPLNNVEVVDVVSRLEELDEQIECSLLVPTEQLTTHSVVYFASVFLLLHLLSDS